MGSCGRLLWLVVGLVLLVLMQESIFWLMSPDDFGYRLAGYKYFAASGFRVFLEAQVALFVLVVLRWLPLYGAVIFQVFFGLILGGAGFAYLEWGYILTPSLIRNNYIEASQVAMNGVSLGLIPCLVVLGNLLCGAMVLVWARRRVTSSRWRLNWVISCLGLIGMLDIAYIVKVDPPYRVNTFFIDQRVMLSYGYVGLWAVDIKYRLFSGHQNSYSEYVAGYDLSTAPRAPASIDRPSAVYLVQWESLDTIALADLSSGFLTDLIRSVGYVSGQSEHLNGSLDTDFSVNTGLPTARGMNPYRLESVGRELYLARESRQAGYAPWFAHCNQSTFFSRNLRMSEFGYEKQYWLDNFDGDRAFGDFWGLDDRVCVSSLLDAEPLKEGDFLYFITLTSHYPYRNIGATNNSDAPIYKRYLMELSNTDTAVKHLASAMPNGALLVIFGDHPALGVSNMKTGKVPIVCAIKSVRGWSRCPVELPDDIPMWQLGRFVASYFR